MSVRVTAAFFSALPVIQAKIFASDSVLTQSSDQSLNGCVPNRRCKIFAEHIIAYWAIPCPAARFRCSPHGHKFGPTPSRGDRVVSLARRRGGGHGLAINWDGMQGLLGGYCGSVVFPREGSRQRRLVKMKRSQVRGRDESARSGQFQ
jgi:hypothetical protein